MNNEQRRTFIMWLWYTVKLRQLYNRCLPPALPLPVRGETSPYDESVRK